MNSNSLNKRRILITTLGSSWQIIPELYGLTNPNDYDFYKNHKNKKKINEIRKKYNIKNINEIWIITTDSSNLNNIYKKIYNWKQHIYSNIKIKFFISQNIDDLKTIQDCIQMGNLIYRVVFTAENLYGKNNIYLSLSGGRKTMSAYMQEAGYLFGCNLMIHIIDTQKIPPEFSCMDLTKPPDENISSIFMPIITYYNLETSPIVEFSPSLEKFLLKIQNNNEKIFLKPSIEFYTEIDKRKKEARSLAYNYRINIISTDLSKNFYELYFLSPRKIERLKAIKIKEIPFNLIKKIPKAELHCHFGGIALPEEIIEIAKSVKEDIEKIKKNNNKFDDWLNIIKNKIKNKDIAFLKEELKDREKLKKRVPSVSQPYNIAGFLSQFEDNIELLKELIYGDFLKSNNFFNIGIKNYEKLGDLQGSSLLQCEKTIRKACKILFNKANKHNVKYLELRCSPLNYTQGELNEKEVIDILTDEILKENNLEIKLILIGSRHRGIELIKRNINFIINLLNKNEYFNKVFVGFDIAGDESKNPPKKLREIFSPLLEILF